MEKRLRNAYQKKMKHYDDVITGRKWWSWLYMNLLWKTDDNKIARRILEMIPDVFSGEILDVPVGTAVFTYAKYLRMQNARIIGLDYSEEMLRLASERIRKENLSNLTLLQGDVRQMPFEEECFDCVLSMNGFQAFPNKDRAFAEIYRVLKVGGLFCGCFYVQGERAVADWFVRKVLDRKGLFVPPHYTRREASEKLHSLFGKNVEIEGSGSTMIFRCIKPPKEDL